MVKLEVKRQHHSLQHYGSKKDSKACCCARENKKYCLSKFNQLHIFMVYRSSIEVCVANEVRPEYLKYPLKTRKGHYIMPISNCKAI